MTSADHRRGLAALAICAVLWSMGGLLIKTIPLSAMAIAGSRSAIAAVVMTLWLRRLRPSWSRHQIGGIIAYAATVLLFVMATKRTTAATAILLQYTAPVWVALFSRFITGERLTRIDIATVGIVCAGMAIFFADGLVEGTLDGTIMALASGMTFALVALFVRAQRGVATTETIVIGNMLTAIVCLPALAEVGSLAGHPMAIGALVLLGSVQLGLSYILYSRALRSVTALDAILVTTIEPLLNPLWVMLATGERPSPLSLAGGIVVLAAVVGRGIAAARRSPAAA